MYILFIFILLIYNEENESIAKAFSSIYPIGRISKQPTYSSTKVNISLKYEFNSIRKNGFNCKISYWVLKILAEKITDCLKHDQWRPF